VFCFSVALRILVHTKTINLQPATTFFFSRTRWFLTIFKLQTTRSRRYRYGMINNKINGTRNAEIRTRPCCYHCRALSGSIKPVRDVGRDLTGPAVPLKRRSPRKVARDVSISKVPRQINGLPRDVWPSDEYHSSRVPHEKSI